MSLSQRPTLPVAPAMFLAIAAMTVSGVNAQSPTPSASAKSSPEATPAPYHSSLEERRAEARLQLGRTREEAKVYELHAQRLREEADKFEALMNGDPAEFEKQFTTSRELESRALPQANKYAARLRQAEADLEAAKAQLKKAESSRDQRQIDRAKQMVRESQRDVMRLEQMLEEMRREELVRAQKGEDRRRYDDTDDEPRK